MARRPGASRGTRFGVAERGSAAVRSGVPGTGSAIAAMSSDFESYEQDFAVLTAEITGRIGKVPKLVGGERLLSAPAALARRARPVCKSRSSSRPRARRAVAGRAGVVSVRSHPSLARMCLLFAQHSHLPAPALSQRRGVS